MGSHVKPVAGCPAAFHEVGDYCFPDTTPPTGTTCPVGMSMDSTGACVARTCPTDMHLTSDGKCLSNTAPVMTPLLDEIKNIQDKMA